MAPADWANLLPSLPLENIAMRLECVEQLVRFLAVCRSWRRAYREVRGMWTPSMPWFVLPGHHRNDNPHIRTVFDPNLSKSYEMDLPELYNCRCWGCRDGWIFTLSLDRECRLFNPLAKTQLSLPSAHALLDGEPSYEYRPRAEFLRTCINKVVLLNVGANNDLVLVLVCSSWTKIAYARPGGFHCLIMDLLGTGPRVEAVVSLQGDLLILFEDWRILRVRADGFLNPDNFHPQTFDTVCDRMFGREETHLVEFDGWLFIIFCPIEFRFMSDIGRPLISAYEYDFESNVWSRDLLPKDLAIFVSTGSAMSAHAPSKAANFNPSSVYYVVDWDYEMGRVIGIFDLYRRRFQRLYPEEYSPSPEYCPPFWFMPKLE